MLKIKHGGSCKLVPPKPVGFDVDALFPKRDVPVDDVAPKRPPAVPVLVPKPDVAPVDPFLLAA